MVSPDQTLIQSNKLFLAAEDLGKSRTNAPHTVGVANDIGFSSVLYCLAL